MYIQILYHLSPFWLKLCCNQPLPLYNIQKGVHAALCLASSWSRWRWRCWRSRWGWGRWQAERWSRGWWSWWRSRRGWAWPRRRGGQGDGRRWRRRGRWRRRRGRWIWWTWRRRRCSSSMSGGGGLSRFGEGRRGRVAERWSGGGF